VKTLRKKTALLEVEVHSLKCKLRDLEREASKNIEDAKYGVERRLKQEQAMREAKIKRVFDDEYRNLWLQKEGMQNDLIFKDHMIYKLTDIVRRQELDTYNPVL
jgi:hypothetical protein